MRVLNVIRMLMAIQTNKFARRSLEPSADSTKNSRYTRDYQSAYAINLQNTADFNLIMQVVLYCKV